MTYSNLSTVSVTRISWDRCTWSGEFPRAPRVSSCHTGMFNIYIYVYILYSKAFMSRLESRLHFIPSFTSRLTYDQLIDRVTQSLPFCFLCLYDNLWLSTPRALVHLLVITWRTEFYAENVSESSISLHSERGEISNNDSPKLLFLESRVVSVENHCLTFVKLPCAMMALDHQVALRVVDDSDTPCDD